VGLEGNVSDLASEKIEGNLDMERFAAESDIGQCLEGSLDKECSEVDNCFEADFEHSQENYN
jgi:hypothetical protein